MFSSRQLEQAPYESMPFRFSAGGLHPDHDTLAHFRKIVLPPSSEWFVRVLRVAADLGARKVEAIPMYNRQETLSRFDLALIDNKRYPCEIATSTQQGDRSHDRL